MDARPGGSYLARSATGGAGVSGDTTRDGLRRLDRDVPAQTDLCVVALGANDMMQLVPADYVRNNLLSIIDKLQQRNIPVLLSGMRAPPGFAPTPARSTRSIPRSLAQRTCP